jgi:hypothetical protein
MPEWTKLKADSLLELADVVTAIVLVGGATAARSADCPGSALAATEGVATVGAAATAAIPALHPRSDPRLPRLISATPRWHQPGPVPGSHLPEGVPGPRAGAEVACWSHHPLGLLVLRRVIAG